MGRHMVPMGSQAGEGQSPLYVTEVPKLLKGKENNLKPEDEKIVVDAHRPKKLFLLFICYPT